MTNDISMIAEGKGTKLFCIAVNFPEVFDDKGGCGRLGKRKDGGWDAIKERGRAVMTTRPRYVFPVPFVIRSYSLS